MNNKRLFVIAMGSGAGFGILTFIALFAFIKHPMKRPLWSEDALKVKHVRAEGLTKLNEQLEAVSVGSTFTIDIDNTTDKDVTLSPAITIMQTSKETGALHMSLLTLPKNYFLPAGQVTSIHLDNDDLCATDVDTKQCFANYFGDQKDIVIFDTDNKYEVRISIPPYSNPVPTGGLPVQIN